MTSWSVSLKRTTCSLVIVETEVCHILEIFRLWVQQQSLKSLLSFICVLADRCGVSLIGSLIQWKCVFIACAFVICVNDVRDGDGGLLIGLWSPLQWNDLGSVPLLIKYHAFHFTGRLTMAGTLCWVIHHAHNHKDNFWPETKHCYSLSV